MRPSFFKCLPLFRSFITFSCLAFLGNACWAQSAPPATPVAPNTPLRPPSATSALKVETGSQHIPAGTLLTIVFQTPLDSKLNTVGDSFVAYLAKDFVMAGDTPGMQRIILPLGTVVRGRVSAVSRPGLFSKGGSLSLAFDHAMLPSGDLMPLTLNLATHNDNVNKAGAVYDDPGIGKKVHNGVEHAKTVFHDTTDRGYQRGKNIAGGLGTIITVPTAAIGGAVAGAGITTGHTAVALVGRGDSAVIKPGDTMTIDFGGSFNLPSE
jgi:hypothetical protein